MLKIHNLTHEQVEMLDKLWSLETMAEIETFKKQLPKFRRQQVDTLMEMVRLQSLDDMVDEYDEGDSYPDAEILLKKIKKSR